MEGSRTPSTKDKGFVGQVVKDPRTPPKVIFLCGFAGSSSEEGHTRLYSDVWLSSYVEIPDEAILHRQDLSGTAAPLGGSLLWIEANAQTIYRPAGEPSSTTDFLEGDLARACPTFGATCSQPPPDPSSSKNRAGGKQGDRPMGNFCSTNFPNCQTAPQAAPAAPVPHGAYTAFTVYFSCFGPAVARPAGNDIFPPTLFGCPTSPFACNPYEGQVGAQAPAQSAAYVPTNDWTCVPSIYGGCVDFRVQGSPTISGCPQGAPQANVPPAAHPVFPTSPYGGCFTPPTLLGCPQPAAAQNAGFTVGCPPGHPTGPVNNSVASVLTIGCPRLPTWPIWGC